MKTGKAPKPTTMAIADASKNNYRYVTVKGKVTATHGVTETLSDSKSNTLSVYQAGGFKQEPKVGETLTFTGIISNYKGTWEISVIEYITKNSEEGVPSLLFYGVKKLF